MAIAKPKPQQSALAAAAQAAAAQRTAAANAQRQANASRTSAVAQQQQARALATRNAQAQQQASVPKASSSPGQAGQPAAGQAALIPDATFLATLAKQQFDRQTQIDSLASQGRVDETNTAESVRRLLAGVPDQQRNIDQTMNRQGLFYSGTRQKARDDYSAQVTQQQSDFTLGEQQRQAARDAARAALEAGATVDEAAAWADLASRQVTTDTSDAAAGALPGSSAAGTAAAGSSAGASAPTSTAKATLAAKAVKRKPLGSYARLGARNTTAALMGRRGLG